MDFLLHLGCALNINVEKQVAPCFFRFSEEALGSAVVIPKDVSMFQELVPADHLLKSVDGYKVVFTAVPLAAAGRPGRVGDGEIEVIDRFAKFVHQSGLSRARRRRDDVNLAHSMFWTCSRDFSISDFMANPNSVIRSASPTTPDVFESSVLASRFISCSKKSSFFPTSPPASSSATKWSL